MCSCMHCSPQAWISVYSHPTPNIDTIADYMIFLHKCVHRHIDTAQMYKNEADVGLAIRESGIPREDIFVSKFASL